MFIGSLVAAAASQDPPHHRERYPPSLECSAHVSRRPPPARRGLQLAGWIKVLEELAHGRWEVRGDSVNLTQPSLMNPVN